MNRTERRRIERFNKKNKSKFKFKKGTLDVSKDKFSNDPVWERNCEKEVELKNTKRFKNSTPLQFLDEMGYEYSTDDEGNLKVRISQTTEIYENLMEGVYQPKIDFTDKDVSVSIPTSLITDYDSLWRITKTGWNSNIGLNPFIGIRKKGSKDEFSWYRWDNSGVLRPLCGTMKWDEKNHSIFQQILINQSLQPSSIGNGIVI